MVFPDRKCEFCNKTFTPKRKKQRFCPGNLCRYGWWKMVLEKAKASVTRPAGLPEA